MPDKARQEIMDAMKALGYTSVEETELRFLDKDRAEVIYKQDKVIGIYDFIRHTFVD